MNVDRTIMTPDEDATAGVARALAGAREGGLVLWLEGDLGAGKTVFARAFLQASGVAGRVKSPTYSLVEPYRLGDGRAAWHLDLYRIADPEELQWLGLDELGDAAAVVLVEWPERGRDMLPAADLVVRLTQSGEGRSLCLTAQSTRGARTLACLPDGD